MQNYNSPRENEKPQSKKNPGKQGFPGFKIKPTINYSLIFFLVSKSCATELATNTDE